MAEGGFVIAFVIGFLANLIFAALALLARSVTLSGALTGLLIGTWIYGILGWRGFSVVAFFFIFGSFFTRWGYDVKKTWGMAQRWGGRRTYREALAKGLGGALFAAGFALGYPFSRIAFVGAFATAFADTTATELGSLYGRRPFLLFPFKRVGAGTPGAISWEGTLLGMLASAGLSVFSWRIGLIEQGAVPWAVVGSTAAFVSESFLARLSIGHDLRNFLNTLMGAFFTVVLVRFFG